jgi:RHS repeat-associated protein
MPYHQPFLWQGRWAENDSATLYDFRARFWSTELGMFVQPDRFQYLGRTGTLWSWPGQNPYRWRDPSGRLAGGFEFWAGQFAKRFAGPLAAFITAGEVGYAFGYNVLGPTVFAAQDELLNQKAHQEREKERQAGGGQAECPPTDTGGAGKQPPTGSVAADLADDDDGPGPNNWGRHSTLADHFERHGADFGARTPEEYAKMASDFLRTAQEQGLPTKTSTGGTVRVYDPASNTFGSYGPDGMTRTFYRPDPAVHGYGSNMAYWDAQPGKPR